MCVACACSSPSNRFLVNLLYANGVDNKRIQFQSFISRARYINGMENLANRKSKYFRDCQRGVNRISLVWNELYILYVDGTCNQLFETIYRTLPGFSDRHIRFVSRILMEFWISKFVKYFNLMSCLFFDSNISNKWAGGDAAINFHDEINRFFIFSAHFQKTKIQVNWKLHNCIVTILI